MRDLISLQFGQVKHGHRCSLHWSELRHTIPWSQNVTSVSSWLFVLSTTFLYKHTIDNSVLHVHVIMSFCSPEIIMYSRYSCKPAYQMSQCHSTHYFLKLRFLHIPSLHTFSIELAYEVMYPIHWPDSLGSSSKCVLYHLSRTKSTSNTHNAKLIPVLLRLQWYLDVLKAGQPNVPGHEILCKWLYYCHPRKPANATSVGQQQRRQVQRGEAKQRQILSRTRHLNSANCQTCIQSLFMCNKRQMDVHNNRIIRRTKSRNEWGRKNIMCKYIFHFTYTYPAWSDKYMFEISFMLWA